MDEDKLNKTIVMNNKHGILKIFLYLYNNHNSLYNQIISKKNKVLILCFLRIVFHSYIFYSQLLQGNYFFILMDKAYDIDEKYSL
jgi:hypothetical protein